MDDTTASASYNPVHTAGQLNTLDGILRTIDDASRKQKYEQVQNMLKKNNSLIVDVQNIQKDASENKDSPENKERLYQCASKIKQINENLTEVYKLYEKMGQE